MKYIRKIPGSVWGIMTGMIILFSCIGLFYYYNVPDIQLTGGDMIEIPYDGDYKELGYVAKTAILKDDVTNQIKVSGTVNPKKIGSYQISYTSYYHHRMIKKVRTVKVVDKKTPSITLEGGEHVFVCPNKEYQELGYRAVDEYDGDITKKVKVKQLENGNFEYRVKDQSGNQDKKLRVVEKKDIEKPTITLKGNQTIYLTRGASYQEFGYDYFDNCDELTNANITISGGVDTSKIGTYTIYYTVKDQSGNEATVERKIIVQERRASTSGGKTIYLTFDDGPSSTITPGILNILKEEGVKATFFVINHDNSLNYLMKRAHDEGHVVAIHSYTHNYKYVYASEVNYFQDLENMQTKIKNITGVHSKLIRFPGGSSNTVSRFNPGIMSRLASQLTQKGYSYFDWNLDSGDAGSARTSQDVYRNVTTGLKGGTYIILMHDFSGNYKTLNALRDIIRYGKSNGYTFATLSANSYTAHHRIAN
ncbi:MAG: polysaccharide deacetylase family protein [Firmicutes bacterium]|nr:polysaccharide deacetylase family protein [Bacillota bacterium]